MQAEIQLAGTTVTVQGSRRGAGAGHDQVARGRVSTESLTVRTADGSFEVHGHIDLAGQRELGLVGKGTLELRPLSAFLPETALTGTAQVDLKVGGTSMHRSPKARSRSRTAPCAPGRAAGSPDRRPGGPRRDGHPARGVPRTPGRRRHRVIGRRSPGRHEDGGCPRGDDGARHRARVSGGDADAPEADLTLTGETGASLLAGTVKAVRGL